MTDVFLFTNRQGLKACDRTLPDLTTDLRCRSGRVLSDELVFECAIIEMIGGVSQKAS